MVKTIEATEPVLVPYHGMVKARVLCCVESTNAVGGQTQRKEGEVFEISVPALWTDDPYVPVTVTGYDSAGVAIVVENTHAPTPLPFAKRKHLVQLDDPTPRQAGSF